MLRFQREPQPGIEQSKPFARDRHRIRMSVMATLTRGDLDYVIDKTATVGREFGFLRSTAT